MKHPAYHLRSNKAVDRLTMVDALKRLAEIEELREYTYYGFGGPYLEDFRLFYEFYPEIRMVSIEIDTDTFKRQKFHAPCNTDQLRLKKIDFKSFLAQYDARDKKSIFWLDYTGLTYGNFEDFMVLLEKVSENSVVKITLRCEPTDFIDSNSDAEHKKREEFRAMFDEVLPHSSSTPPPTLAEFANLLQEMLQIAAERALPGTGDMMFLPLASFFYKDGVGMFTLTGLVCSRAQRQTIRNVFRDWSLSNLQWRKPRLIDVPNLSTKERLHLQRQLPCESKAGLTLLRGLGYLIDEDRRKSIAKLQQYADFHRYFPYFMKAVP